jgi:GTPase SAR1 family protein
MNSIPEKPEAESVDTIRIKDLSICAQNVCNSENRRGSGSSSPNGSSSSSVNNSPISYSEYSMTGSANEESENEISNDPERRNGSFKQQEASSERADVRNKGMRRVQTCPEYSKQNVAEDYDDFDISMYHGAISTSQLPEVFEEEEEESSHDYFDPENRNRNRHDSGIEESFPSRQRRQRRQRYNSSSIRRTQVTSFVSDYIERRGSAQNMPVGPSRDEYCIRSALKTITDPLNVLVIGPHDSGKTTLINSLLMSVTGDWSDRAPYGIGRSHNLGPVVLYENPDHHRRCRTRSDNSGRYQKRHYHHDPTWKRGQDDPCGRVVMWDTRGFEKIYDDNHQALLLRYILEGRLQRENLQQALLLSDEICKKRYKNVVKDNQIDLILYVASAEERPDLKLFKALQKAKLDSKDEKARNCPILLTMTKFDLLPASEQDELKQNIFFYHPESYALYENGEFCPDVSL